MMKILRIAVCLLLIGSAVEQALGAGPSDKKTALKEKPGEKKSSTAKKAAPKKSPANAAGLLSDMEKATAYILKEAQAPAAAGEKTAGKLDPKQKSQKPFWSGLKTINTNVDGMKKAIAAQDPNFFKILDASGRAVAQINDSAQLMRIRDKHVLNGVKALSISYHALRKNFGKEAARKKKGGELSAKEKEQLTQMQTEVKKLQSELQAMQGKVEAKKNPRLLSQINDLSKLASEVAGVKGTDVNAYTEMLYLLDYLSNDWYAFGLVVQVNEPDLYAVWTSSNSSFESYFSYYETTYTSIEFTEWSSFEVPVEVLDVEATYEIEVSASEVTTTDSFIEGYSETSATAEMTTEESAAEDADTSSHDDDFYDAADDDDGDGLEEAEDTDDGDGVADNKDNNDDNDGVADDDSDGDGTADATDDDDNDGTPDAQDGDDDGDGASDDEDTDDGDGASGDEGGDEDGGDEE